MIGIFGGTFDPIHIGHINIATECVQQLGLDKLYFMPCATPAHKASPGVSAADRANMVELAIQNYPEFALDDRELKRQGASYSVLSLRELRAEYPDTSIVFLIGMDSLNNLDHWYHWQEITKLCHLVVCQRPGQVFAPSKQIEAYLKSAMVKNQQSLRHNQAGKVMFLKTTEYDVSSTQQRKILQHQTAGKIALPKAVNEYIKQKQLYKKEIA